MGTAVCSSHWLRNLGGESSISEEALGGGAGGGGRGVKTARGRGGTSPGSNAAALSGLRSHTASPTCVYPVPTPCPGTGNGRTEVSKKTRSGPCRETPCSELPGPSGEGRPVEGQTFPNMTQPQLGAGLAAAAAAPILGLGSLSPGQQVQRLGARHLQQRLFWGLPGLRPRDRSQSFT